MGDMPVAGSGMLRLTLTPRVFASSQTQDVAIGFTLDRGGPVTVRVYTRSGRLVRAVVPGATMAAGANLVRWDGRDESGTRVSDGLYLVAGEFPGDREVAALSVVR